MQGVYFSGSLLPLLQVDPSTLHKVTPSGVACVVPCYSPPEHCPIQYCFPYSVHTFVDGPVSEISPKGPNLRYLHVSCQDSCLNDKPVLQKYASLREGKRNALSSRHRTDMQKNLRSQSFQSSVICLIDRLTRWTILNSTALFFVLSCLKWYVSDQPIN